MLATSATAPTPTIELVLPILTGGPVLDGLGAGAAVGRLPLAEDVTHSLVHPAFITHSTVAVGGVVDGDSEILGASAVKDLESVSTLGAPCSALAWALTVL